jgi:predicted Rossmann-fold nucleotide-binding protein
MFQQKIISNQIPNQFNTVEGLLKSDPFGKGHQVGSTQEVYKNYWSHLTPGSKELIKLVRILNKAEKNDPEFFKYFVGNLVNHPYPHKIMRLFVEYSKVEMLGDKIDRMLQVYGSARTAETHGYYQDALVWTQYLIKQFKEVKGVEICIGTGAGPGQMEAGNQAAHHMNVPSAGFRLWFPQLLESPNPYMDQMLFFTFFVPRLSGFQDGPLHLITAGGAGTMDELFGVLALKAMGMRKDLKLGLQNSPVYVAGTRQIEKPEAPEYFYDGLQHFIKKVMHQQYGLVSRDELHMYKVLNSPEDAFDAFKDFKLNDPSSNGFRTYRKFMSYQEDHQKSIFRQTQKPVKALVHAITHTLATGTPDQVGIVNAAVWNFIHNDEKNNGRNDKYLHAVTELAANKNIFKNKAKSTTFILPQRADSKLLEAPFQHLKLVLPRIKSSITFDNQGVIVENLFKDSVLAKKRVRILDTVVSGNVESFTPAQEYYPFKRHDVKNMILVDSSHTFVIAPGGYTTQGIFWHLMDIIQTKKLKPHQVPLIILWDPYMDFYTKLEKDWIDPLIARGMVNPNFKTLYVIESDLDKVIGMANKREFEIKQGHAHKPQ